MRSHTTRLRSLPALRPRPKRFLLQIVFLISLLVLLSLPIFTRAIAHSSDATNATNSSGETQNPARLSEHAGVRALGRRSPLVNLGDGHDVLTSPTARRICTGNGPEPGPTTRPGVCRFR